MLNRILGIRFILALMFALFSIGCRTHTGTGGSHLAEETGARLSVSKDTFAIGEAITVQFKGAPGQAKDWIGIYNDPVKTKESLDWVYVNGTRTASAGAREGTVTLPGRLVPGKYRLRFLSNDGYNALAQDLVINVVKEGFAKLPPTELTLMTFNNWNGATHVNDGLNKLVKGVQAAGADIVAFQEVPDPAAFAAEKLGWYSYNYQSGTRDTSILSKYPIVETFDVANSPACGARIRLSSGQEILVVSAHLYHDPYGPYLALFDKVSDTQILQREEERRGQEIQQILAKMKPYIQSGMPVFLLGDFNTPSHLDWTEGAKSLHGGRVINWPVTRAVEAAGLLDSYRAIYPDPLKDPGFTWSPVYTKDTPYDSRQAYEPQDRLDFIYFSRGVQVKGSKVFVVGTPNRKGAHSNNDWPSDHAAVVSEFVVNP